MKKLFFLFLSVLLTSMSFAQTKLTGRVTDADDYPIVGASIVVKGTTNGTITDVDGNFTLLSEQEEGVLLFSFIGMTSVEKSFNQSQDFQIQMYDEFTALNDVVVIGYGTSKKGDLTNVVASATNVEQISSRPVSNAESFLQGNIAGVTVVNEGGDPASMPKITIRGMGTINNGSENVLWIVDGMPYDGGTINPNDIESIDVLKDASAAAIYGAQAGSGVIVVTTKSGKTGKLKVDIDAFTGIQDATNLPTPLTAQQQSAAYNTAADNSGMDRYDAHNANLNPWGTTTRTNWIDEIFRTASVNNLNGRIYGGTEKVTYSASVNYQDKEGLLLGTSSERLGMRVKTDFHVSDRITIGQNTYITHEEAIGSNTSSGYSGVIINAMYMPSAAPVYQEDGTFHGVAPEGSDYAGAYGDVYNPVALLLRPTTKNPITNINANVYGQWEIIDGLQFKTAFALTQNKNDYKQFQPMRPENGRPSEMNYLYQSWANRNKWVWDNQITYNKDFGKHHIDLTGVYSSQLSKYEYNYIEGSHFAREESWYQYLANAGQIDNYESDAYEDALTSLIGRARYDFNGKYFVTASVRSDASSRLHKDNNSDVFPAVSGGWKISEESFLKNVSWLNMLKLRASWGKIGNINSAYYYAYNVPMSSQDPTMGAGDAQRVQGYYVRKNSNTDLTWESSESTDFGVDASFLRGKVELTADYFVKKTQDMIMQTEVDSHSGINDGADVNGGMVENKGFELALTYKGKVGDFQYAVNGNVSSVKNELKNLKNFNTEYIAHSTNARGTLYPYRSIVGKELYSYYLISSAGTFKSQQEIDSYTHEGNLIQPNAQPGDLKFIDQNNDGVIDNEDRTFKGSAFPDFTYGINLSGKYKNFDISMVFQGVSGSKIFNAMKFTTYNAAQQGYNLDNRVLNAWSTTNSNSNIPLLRLNDPNQNFETASDWYLEDGSYLRMKNLTIGYNIPETLMNRVLQGSSLRVYVSAENLFTLTDYSGIDPEVGGIGMDMGKYPVARTFSAGVSLKF
ncbi:SusC/RagA family TonB-linked outer membrane protein [Plebeiibacterium sediminum]|uniref:TonB-dependent receptor n=1 Tax=Plebeiibacterium sediminum TaxID=2992112 RepID=A0AAE3M3F6_9BACT|nr:TonB-dependent receptor [Plebeiobacterium sediminum]MCW3786291.1 TonB-dependent receptor [Plebeiobacterium sediminum]